MAEPVPLALAKAHCRIDPSDTDHDVVLATHIQAAREWVEDFTGLVMVSRTLPSAVEVFGAYVQLDRGDRESTSLNSRHACAARIPASARTKRQSMETSQA